MDRAGKIWLALGWIGFAVLPWCLAESAASYTIGSYGSALALGIAGGRPWLLPLTLPLLFALSLLPHRPDRGRANGLIAVGVSGLVWLVVQGILIDHRGWTLGALSTLWGSPGPSQEGMGYGAFLFALTLLMLLCRGLAWRGACRGDAFIASAIGLVLALIVIFVLFPLAKVLVSAIQDNAGNLAPALFTAKFADSSIWGLGCLHFGVACGVAWNSLFLAALIGVGTTALGLAFALIVTRTGFPLKRGLRGLTILPVITPPFVIGLAIILLFGRSGALSSLMYEGFGVPRSRWIYGLPGILLAQLLSFTPTAFLLLIGVVEGVSPTLEEASQTLRARPWTTFSTVSLPLIRPGLANAFLLGFVESLADFGNPLVLGGNFEVLSTKIFFAVVGAAHDQGRAAVLAIILLGFTLAAFIVQHRWLGRRAYTSVTGKGDAGLPAKLPRSVAWGCFAAAIPWTVLTIVVYATILIGGLVKTMGRDYTPTLTHYLTAFAVEPGAGGLRFTGSAWDSLWTTLAISTAAAPLTALLGLVTAYLLSRQEFAGRRAFEFAAMASFAVPGTVVGVAYVLAFNTPPIELTGTALILVISFVFRNMPVGIRAGVAAMSQIDRSLDEASLTLGAGAATTLRRVILPLLRPAVIAALVYSFVHAVTAVSAVIFLASARHNMATVYIVGRVEAGEFGLAIAYSSVLIVIVSVAIVVIQMLVGERRLGRRAAATISLQSAA
jgi:iron(III) transport system permease protein